MEKQFLNIFKEFLLSKGYPENSLLFEFKSSKIHPKFRPDLLVIDTENDNFLCLFEFKSSTWEKSDLINEINYYQDDFLSNLQEDIPVYLVLSFGFGKDFQIFKLTDGALKLIPDDEFPRYETLVSQQKTEEKIEKERIQKSKIGELKERKKRVWLSSMLSILSLVVGIITVVYSLNLNKKTNNSSTFSSSCNCDSIKTEIKNLKKLINQIDKKTNQNVSSSKNNPVNSDIADLTNRIEVIEKGISDNPEKTLSLLNMNNDISQLEKSDESLREINKTEIESLKNEMENQNSWISGLLITIFGLVLSFAVPNLLANIKENKLN